MKSDGLVRELDGLLSKDENQLTKGSKDETKTLNQDQKGRSTLVKQPLIWLNITIISIYHLAALYAFITFPYVQRPLTFLWGKPTHYSHILFI